MSIWTNPEIWLFLWIRFLNFFFIPVVQEYLNEIAPTLNGSNKLKTSRKPQRIADLQPPLQDKTNRTPCSYHFIGILPFYFVYPDWDSGISTTSTGCPVCLVLKQGAVNQLFFEVFLMFLACLDHSRSAKFHLGLLGPQEWKKSSEILSGKKVKFQGCLKLTIFWFLCYGGC